MARTKQTVFRQTAKKSCGGGVKRVEQDHYQLRRQLATKTGPRRLHPKYRELPPIKLAQKKLHKKGLF
jgi:hypothetical protein